VWPEGVTKTRDLKSRDWTTRDQLVRVNFANREICSSTDAGLASGLVFVLAAVAAVDTRLWRLRMSADEMANKTQKLQATLSAAVESRQTGLDPFVL